MQVRDHQFQSPGVRPVAGCLQCSEEQGVAIWSPEALRCRLERLNEVGGGMVRGGDSIADHSGEVVEVSAAGGQVMDCAGDGGHRHPIDAGDLSI